VKRIFVCPGNCKGCKLTISECPSRGMLQQESGIRDLVKIFAEALQPQLDQMLLEKISPESIVESFESDIFRLAQSLELIEEVGGKKMGRALVEKEIKKLIPAIEFGERNSKIKKQFSMAIRNIALKILEIKRRACQGKGIACERCYMYNACLQRIEE
jgi:hypothetical protein